MLLKGQVEWYSPFRDTHPRSLIFYFEFLIHYVHFRLIHISAAKEFELIWSSEHHSQVVRERHVKVIS